MSQVIPFNNQPDSTSIKTGSYTVPSGKYAKVTVTNLEADFTIDSVLAIEQATHEGSASNSTTGTKFTNATPYILVGSASQTIAGTFGIYSNANQLQTNYYNGASMTYSTNAGGEIVLKPNDTLDVTSGGGGTVYWSLSAIDVPVGKEFWVPAGTDLDGARYVVELYNELT